MCRILAALMPIALLAAGPAQASHLVFRPNVGMPGGYAVLQGKGSGSVVVPGVNGGLAIFNSDKSVVAVVPNVGAGAAFAGSVGLGSVFPGYAWNTGGGEGGPVTGGVVVGGFGFRTLPPAGTGFCLPPCAPTADGVAPDGTVMTARP